MRTIERIIALATLMLACTVAVAQSWPAKTLRIIIAFPPGGVTDTLARIVAQELSPALGQPVLVENRPGAGSLIGTAYAAKSAPDGYTFLTAAASVLAINSVLYSKSVTYNPLTSFAPVTQLILSTILICVNSSVPAKTVEQLVRLAAEQPDALNYGSAGIGSAFHIAIALFASVTNLKLTHIPNRGSAEALTDLVAGRVQIMSDAPFVFKPQIDEGKVRCLGVMGDKRSPLLPEVPTMDEQGYKGLVLRGGSSILAPSGTPDAILDRMNVEIVKVIHKPEVRKKLNDLGMEPLGSSRKDFGAQFATDFASWANATRITGAKVE